MKNLQKGLVFSLLFATAWLHAQMSVSIQVNENIACFGGSNGSLTAIVTPAGLPYTFSWSNGATTATNAGLGAGAYIVTVQNAAGGSVIATAILDEPEALVLTSLTELPLMVNPTGTVEVETTGGTEPFAFQWTDQNNFPVANSEDLIDAPAGVYTQTATDANGCTATLTPVELTLTSGMHDVLDITIRTFPNPASQHLTIDLQTEGNVLLQVFNGLGQWMESIHCQNQSTTISVENWPAGLYALVFPTLGKTMKVTVEH